jgi:hypothetical protein
MSVAITEWRCRQSPEERKAHNAKSRAAYRNTVAEALLYFVKSLGLKDSWSIKIREWQHGTLEHLRLSDFKVTGQTE